MGQTQSNFPAITRGVNQTKPDMKNLLNIDKSAFRKGEYVGYCNGAQRIRKVGNQWQTYSLGSQAGKFIPASAETLAELSKKLAMAKQSESNPNAGHVAAFPKGRW